MFAHPHKQVINSKPPRNRGVLGSIKMEIKSKKILEAIDKDKHSKTKKLMQLAKQYYRNENDILQAKRTFIGRNGERVNDDKLANNKLAHPFMRKLVDQKINYILSKPFSIQTESNELQDILTSRFNKKFFRMLKNIAKDAITCGIAWLQVYYNEHGELKLKRIDPIEVIPTWEDIEHSEISQLVRYYTDFDDDGNELVRVEVYTQEGQQFYHVDRGVLVEDSTGGHFVKVTTEGIVESANWGRIPFIAFKYNSEELPLLQFVKALIDDYDRNCSDISNNLQDVPDSIKVLSGCRDDAGTIVHNLSVFRLMILPDATAEVKALTTPLDTTAYEAHLKRLRKDIYDAGFGVDSQESAIGNVSGVALRFRYADLDLDAHSIITEFSAALEELSWFIAFDEGAQALKLIERYDVDYIFNTDMLVNESETIANCQASMGIISQDTIIANHPWITDVEEENDRLNDGYEEEEFDEQVER